MITAIITRLILHDPKPLTSPKNFKTTYFPQELQNHLLPPRTSKPLTSPKNFKISGLYFKTFTSGVSDQNPT
jgi:hypothetical protein